jgi:putative acetyltransferase
VEIRRGDFDDRQVVDLLRLHFAGMSASSPEGCCHYLDLSGLQAADVSFWTIWDGDALLGCGALKRLDPDHAEVKSMRTHPAQLGRGAGRAMLEHIIAEAAARGHRRLSLETGSGEAFEPALGLYRSRGFVSSGPFGGYVATPFNQFMTLAL